jgi:DnaK suppressor protein
MENTWKTIQTKLRKRYAELSDRLGRVGSDGRHAAGLNPDFEEQAVERENDDVLANLDTAIRAEILQIEEALRRMDSGRYGICERCKKPIAASRLKVLPHAVRCVNCEDNLTA